MPVVTVRKCLSQSSESRQSPVAHWSSSSPPRCFPAQGDVEGAGLSCGRGGHLMSGDHHPLCCPPVLPHLLVMLKDPSLSTHPGSASQLPCARGKGSVCVLRIFHSAHARWYRRSAQSRLFPCTHCQWETLPAHTSRPGIRQLFNVQVTCSLPHATKWGCFHSTAGF